MVEIEDARWRRHLSISKATVRMALDLARVMEQIDCPSAPLQAVILPRMLRAGIKIE
jgi:hypothetical protein